jgi:hypothetical protein
MKCTGLLRSAAAASICLCAVSAQAQSATPGSRSGFGYTAAEFMPDSEIANALPLLASQHVGLALPFAAAELTTTTHFALANQATALGVEIRPWLLLPDAEGYWPGSSNAAEYDGYARRLVDAWAEAGLKPTTFVVDMEMPLARAERFAQLATAFDTTNLIAFLKQGINRTQYAAATKIYRDLVVYLHSKGWRVQVTTLTQVVDDYADGDDGLRQAFNVPLEGIAWDEVNIQAYRTLNELVMKNVAGPTTSYYVFDYALRARVLWGARAGVSIGCTDPGDIEPDSPSYRDGNQLREDVDAAALAGIPRNMVGLYQLRGIVRRPPVTQWFPARSLIALPPLPDVPTVLTHTSSAVLDAAM